MNKSKILETLTSISKIKVWLSTNKGLTLLATALLILSITEFSFHSRIVILIEKRVTRVIKEQSIPLLFKSLDYGYFPPRLIMKEALYSDGKNTAKAEEVSISTKILPLIKLKLVPDTLDLYKPDIRWILNLKKDKPTEINFKKIIESFPLYKIKMGEGALYLENKKTNIHLQNLDLEVTKSTRSITTSLSSFTEVKYKDFLENFSININTNLDKDSLYIKYLNLQKENSILKVSGSVNADELFKQNKNLSDVASIYSQLNELRINTKVDLNDFNNFLKLVFKTNKNFNGEVQATGYFNKENLEQKSSIALLANNIQMPRFNLKAAKINASVSPKNITLKKDSFISFKPDSIIKIQSANIEKTKSGYWTKFKIKSDGFLLEDLLHTLDIPNSFFNSPIAIDSECKGSLFPTLTLSCSGDLDIKKFILTSKEETSFVDINRLQSRFRFNTGTKGLSFYAEPVYNNTNKESFTGKISGNIHYKNGFSITYKTDAFDLEFLNSIAGQSLNGIIAAEGKTEGSARWGRFFVDIKNSKDLTYNKFYLGKAKTKMTYSYPNLNIQDVEGHITENDSYTANFSLDTNADLMNLKIKSNDLSSKSISKVFKEFFTFPEGIQFKGSDFQLTFVGEPDIEKLDLNLSSTYPNLNVFGERFNQSSINLKGQKGEWSFYKTYFKKAKSSFTVDGKVFGFKEINLTLKNLDLHLENIDNLQKMGIKINGPAIFKLDAIGPIEGPKAFGRVQLKSTTGLRGKDLGNTDFGFRILENQIIFEGKAFDGKIIGNGIYPLNENGHLAFNGSVDNLDLFHIVEFKFDDFSTHYLPLTFTSDVTLFSNNGTPVIKGWVDKLDIEFKNASEKILKFKTSETVQFDRGDSAFSVTSAKDYKADLFIRSKNDDSIELRLNGPIEAHALQAFIPKTEILRGLVDVKNVKLVIADKKIKHYGEINFVNGTFKSKSFPYNFTDLNTKLKLNENKITFNRVDTRINNSPLLLSGFITTLPLSIETLLQYNNLRIEYPKGISSLSDGILRINGSNLPLLAKGRIYVKEGEFKRDLLTGVDGKTIIANKFLPKEILHENAPPFDLDLLLKISDNYVVTTSEINGNAKGELKLDGNIFNPLTRGRIELQRGTTINFLDKIFSVQEGHLNYANNYINNPNLYIDATTEVSDNNDITSNKYFIRMLVEGPAENLKFSLNSNPSLVEKEIISLLTLGTVSTQLVGQEISTQQQATHSGLQVGSFLLQQNKGIQELQKKTGTKIGISSSVDTFNVNPKVQLKKKWSPKLSSTVSQSFGNQQVLELSTKYQVNQSISTSLTIKNNQTQDATQLLNRRIQQGEIFGIDLQYKFEFD